MATTFTTAGPKCEIDWFETLLEQKYELKKGGRLGPGPEDTKELTVLNRVIRWVDGGVEYEADPRQAERLLEGLGLDGDGCKPMATPGVKLGGREAQGGSGAFSRRAHGIPSTFGTWQLPRSG